MDYFDKRFGFLQLGRDTVGFYTYADSLKKYNELRKMDKILAGTLLDDEQRMDFLESMYLLMVSMVNSGR